MTLSVMAESLGLVQLAGSGMTGACRASPLIAQGSHDISAAAVVAAGHAAAGGDIALVGQIAAIDGQPRAAPAEPRQIDPFFLKCRELLWWQEVTHQ